MSLFNDLRTTIDVALFPSRTRAFPEINSIRSGLRLGIALTIAGAVGTFATFYNHYVNNRGYNVYQGPWVTLPLTAAGISLTAFTASKLFNTVRQLGIREGILPPIQVHLLDPQWIAQHQNPAHEATLLV